MDKKTIGISLENIKFNFELNSERYFLISQNDYEEDEENLFFVKMHLLEDGSIYFKEIESDEEYNQVLIKFEEIMSLVEEVTNE